MSTRLFKEDLLFEQRLLKCGGFYRGKLDALYGNLTREAEEAAYASYLAIQKQLGAFDPRSEANIQTLLPEMQKKARMILGVAKKRERTTGLACRILSGTRTYNEQTALYKRRPKVTNAMAGQSNHNFGIAIDLGIFEGMDYFEGGNAREEKAYRDIAQAIKAEVHDIEWGGDWRSFKDMPHYQLKVDYSLAEVRKRFEKGLPFD
jgi:peptidoglycan L-alanyl-D-glutamate endopeptidase CwlK